MHESGSLTWREVVDKYHSALVDELSGRLDSELQDAVARAVAVEREQTALQLGAACDNARRLQAEALNQAIRRFRQATGEERVLEILGGACAAYCEKLVVLVFESHHIGNPIGNPIGDQTSSIQARVTAGYGVAVEGSPAFEVNAAAAIVAAIESRDPVVALGTEAEISPVLAGLSHGASEGKTYLFPVSARQTVVGMLVAGGTVISAPIELLCEAAGLRLETPRPPEVRAAAKPEARSWDSLSPEDQKIHLQAQRMARVRVAEMRLGYLPELNRGAAANDIYGALKTQIDAARDQFLQNFLSQSTTMVDYLHLEIVQSLAHDDDRLLGRGYPGPMV